MAVRCVAAARALAVLLASWPLAGMACSTAGTGARCVVVPASAVLPASLPALAAVAAPAVEVGAVLERGRYSILMNAEYYGLPPVSDGWVYMRIDRDLFRVDWRSHAVLERVTHEAAANF